ncbi:MAG: hypothetical protein JW751_08965 [Polyangiaceae bacterium]|nr:hypothetical protein [Polyangiaceae bacterium]
MMKPATFGVAIALGALLTACAGDGTPPMLSVSGSSGGTGAAPTGGTVATGGQLGIGGAGSVVPSVSGNVYSFDIGSVSFDVNAAVGARITSLSVGGVELLSGSAVHSVNYGSTFWTSPHSDWYWPPPPTIDATPYTATLDGNTVTMTGGSEPTLGVSVSKTFSADAGTGWIRLSYAITNTATAPRSFAPWEVTRVPTGGLAFFPRGPGGVAADTTLEHTEVATEVWFDSATQGPQEAKLVADGGGGWSAHAASGYLFVKRFPDLPVGAAAAGEAEVAIYLGVGYVELEVQGALTEIAPGGSSAWTVEWKVVPIPTGISVAGGSADLVALATATVAG